MGSVRLWVVAFCTTAAVAVGIPVVVSAAPSLAVPAVVTASADASADSDPAAYRARLLQEQDSAIAVHDASLAAQHAKLVADLGYEPGTTDPREIARQMMANFYQWGDDQFACYDKIIMRESKWSITADNPHSTAYGIPQALPGSKMAEFGSDWRTNPATQIRWGLDYVQQRYGTPCQAWSFKHSHGWY